MVCPTQADEDQPCSIANAVILCEHIAILNYNSLVAPHGV